jgi:predicted acetyltransferase
MSQESLQLVRPSLELESAYMSMNEEFQHGPPLNGYGLKPLRWGEFAAHVAELQAQEREDGLPEGIVPQTTFWLLRNGDCVIGEIQLRHRLTPALERFGGNIGYAVRPSERRKGYARLMLKLVLDEARKLGMKRVLLTCSPDNTASARVMLANGAVQTTDGAQPETGEPKSRYWIEL